MRKYTLLSFFLLICLFIPAETYKISFDSQRTKSGAKISLHDINDSLPQNWTEYNYVGIEYRVTTTQRFLLGFTTDHGYDEVMVHSYVPNQWNRLIIPLIYLSQMPASSIDFASMYNKPRQTGWINIGGNVGPMTGVDSIGFRQYRPSVDAQVEIRNVELYMDDPGDAYLGDIPALDEFGQSNLMDWKGKAHNLKELKKLWQAEEKEKVSAKKLFDYSPYGGYLAQQVQGTGFFRTEKKNGRWWLVDPDGYLFLSVGVCCISLSSGGEFKDMNKREDMLKQVPPNKFIYRDRRGNTTADFAAWNLERRFGTNNEQAALELTLKRMDKWGVNTIGNWSDKRVEKANRKAFTCTMTPAYVDNELFGLGDAYEPNLEEKLEESLRNLMADYRDNPWLIGYYIGNEPTWVGSEWRVCDQLLKGRERAMKTALIQYLKEHGDTPENRKTFVYETFDKYLAAIKHVQNRLDPNHMNLGYRFANPNSINETLAHICTKYFDVMSFNSYCITPNHKLMDKILGWADLPMIIGEFHFGAVDHGLGQSLIQVRTQEDRGKAYRNYVENAFAHPGLVGTTYFTWYDECVMGRFDGENYNCGLIDVTNVPYHEQTKAMMKTARRLYQVHAGKKKPFNDVPDYIIDMDRGKDEW